MKGQLTRSHILLEIISKLSPVLFEQSAHQLTLYEVSLSIVNLKGQRLRSPLCVVFRYILDIIEALTMKINWKSLYYQGMNPTTNPLF